MRALDGVDFDARPGQITVIVGTNGSGKSTLLRIIHGSLQPDSGAVEINCLPVSVLNARARAKQMGLLDQQPLSNLCPNFTVEEMWRVYLDGKVAPKGRGGGCALAVSLAHRGISNNSTVRELSGGQQQLLALELVLARRPAVVLLDEPTSALDFNNAAHMHARLRTAARPDRYLVLVSHDLDEAALLGDVIHVLHGGRVLQRVNVASGDRLSARKHVAELLSGAHMIGSRHFDE